MNTKQLITLWYSGIALIFVFSLSAKQSVLFLIPAILILTGLFLFTFREHPKADKRSVMKWIGFPLGTILAIFILLIGVALIIETIKDRSRPVSKSLKDEYSFVEPGDEFDFLGPSQFQIDKKVQIPVDLIEIVDVKIIFSYSYNMSKPSISGWVKNRSNKTLTSFLIDVKIMDSSGQFQTSSTMIPNNPPPGTPTSFGKTEALRVPPGETRRFNGKVDNLDRPTQKGWATSYKLTDAWGRSN